MAIGFELELTRIGQPDSYFQSLAQELEPKRDFMAKMLEEVGMIPTIPEGGYFMIADWTPLGRLYHCSSVLKYCLPIYTYTFVH